MTYLHLAGFFPPDVVTRAMDHGLEENMWLAAMLHDVTLVSAVQDDLASQVSFALQGGILVHEYLSDPQPQVTPSTKLGAHAPTIVQLPKRRCPSTKSERSVSTCYGRS